MKKEKSHYRTFQIWIKPGHRMYSYFESICQNAKNLYNSTNFYVRQVYTALTQEKLPRPLQQDVLNTLERNIGKMNEVQRQAYTKKAEKESTKPQELQKPVKCNTFTLPSKDKAFLTYGFLDCLFKVIA